MAWKSENSTIFTTVIIWLLKWRIVLEEKELNMSSQSNWGWMIKKFMTWILLNFPWCLYIIILLKNTLKMMCNSRMIPLWKQMTEKFNFSKLTNPFFMCFEILRIFRAEGIFKCERWYRNPQVPQVFSQRHRMNWG